MAGHGEGAGEAAMIAMHNVVWRVALLSGPDDTEATHQSVAAGWLSGTPTTARENWRGLRHLSEDRAVAVASCWTALGLGSSDVAVNIDSAQKPGPSAHFLTTNASGLDTRGVIAVDTLLPVDPTVLDRIHNAWKVLFWPF